MQDLHNYCIENKKTLCTVESCTAGLLSHTFTMYSGASKWYKGGLVVYTNEMKVKLLGIDPERIKKYTAVSREIVDDMCSKGLELFDADICVATSGYIEPGDSAQCYICIIKKGKENAAFEWFFTYKK